MLPGLGELGPILGVLFPFGSYFRIKVKQDVVTLKYRASLPYFISCLPPCAL